MTDTEHMHAHEGEFTRLEPMTYDWLLSNHPENLEPGDWFDTYRQPCRGEAQC